MKTMQTENTEVSIIIEKSDDGFWVTVEDLPGCYSFGKSVQEALTATKDAIADHIQGLHESGEAVPQVFNGQFKFIVKYDLQSLFESFRIINKTALAEYVGINASLLRQYTKGLAFAGEKQREKIERALHQLGKELMQVHL
jgi:predicted RNase H-like HicB family nuclease